MNVETADIPGDNPTDTNYVQLQTTTRMSRGKRLNTDPDFLTGADALIATYKEVPKLSLTFKGEAIIPLETLTEAFRVKHRTFLRYAEAGLLQIYTAKTGNLKFVTQKSFDDFIDKNFILVGKERVSSDKENN